MANSYFQFKQFTIQQQLSAMKVGTDGVLLGAWTATGNAKQILDIGTGTGLIALMLAQKSKATITAIEIDDLAFEEAKDNCKKSPWPDQITIINDSLQLFTSIATIQYDIIVSNPPFFNNSLKSNDNARNYARHTDSLSYNDLFGCAARLLSAEGLLNIIIPTLEFENCIEIACKKGLFANKVLQVKPTPSAMPKRSLITFTKQQTTINEQTLIIEDRGRHQYSEEYKNLTKEYYLNF